MDPQPPEPKRQRLTRAEAKARTRALLLDAAAQVFARKGFTGASVEEIAETAGFSIGALYSNFGSKDELFVELLSTYKSDQIAEAARVIDEGAQAPDGDVRTLGSLLIDVADKNDDLALLEAEFWLYSVRNPQVLAIMADRMREPREALEKLVGDALHRQNSPLTQSTEQVATVVAALFHGLVRRRRIDPDSVPEELYGTALQWLFAGINATQQADA